MALTGHVAGLQAKVVLRFVTITAYAVQCISKAHSSTLSAVMITALHRSCPTPEVSAANVADYDKQLQCNMSCHRYNPIIVGKCIPSLS